MQDFRMGIFRALGVVALGTLCAFGIVVGCGKLLGLGPWYYADARKVESLAREIPGVEVIDVNGNHDLTLESLWLSMRYRGEPLYLQSVTPESFERWTEYLGVGYLGNINLSHYSYPSEEREAKGDWDRAGGTVHLGPGTLLAGRIDPPFASIPDLLERIEELRAFVDSIPAAWPGLRIVESDGRIHHIRKAGPAVSPAEREHGAPESGSTDGR